MATKEEKEIIELTENVNKKDLEILRTKSQMLDLIANKEQFDRQYQMQLQELNKQLVELSRGE